MRPNAPGAKPNAMLAKSPVARIPSPQRTSPSQATRSTLPTKSRASCLAQAGGFGQSYNAQASVDTRTMLVITAHVTQAPNDKREIVPVLDKVQALPESLGEVTTLLADCGYFSAANVQACVAQDIEPLLAIKRERTNLPYSNALRRMRPGQQQTIL